jgi:hypothetical protein
MAAIDGGGKVSKELRVSARSFWWCFFSAIHSAWEQELIKELLFWGHIYHAEDTVVHILYPAMREFVSWRQRFSVGTFPSVVLADSHDDPAHFVVFSADFLNTKAFGDPLTLRSLLDYYHSKLSDGASFGELRQTKTWKDLASISQVGFEKLASIVSFFPKIG